MSKVEKKSHVWERGSLDWYVEPESSSAALFRVEKFVGPVFDPCCGGGNIVKSAITHGLYAEGSDVVERFGEEVPLWWRGTQDFLASNKGRVNTVMNPPFFRGVGTESFIRKALSLSTGKVAAFVEVRFLTGKSRAQGLYKDFPPQRVWIVTPRPSCPPGEYLAAGSKAGGGSLDYCWMVWSHLEPVRATEMRWLNTGAL